MEKKPTILVACHEIGLQRPNIQIDTYVPLSWSPSPPVLAASSVASWSSVIWATNCHLAVDVHIIVSFFEAKSGKIEKLLGTFFVPVIQGVIPGATEDTKNSSEKFYSFPSLSLSYWSVPRCPRKWASPLKVTSKLQCRERVSDK